MLLQTERLVGVIHEAQVADMIRRGVRPEIEKIDIQPQTCLIMSIGRSRVSVGSGPLTCTACQRRSRICRTKPRTEPPSARFSAAGLKGTMCAGSKQQGARKIGDRGSG
jgi:hypothetical protein